MTTSEASTRAVLSGDTLDGRETDDTVLRLAQALEDPRTSDLDLAVLARHLLLRLRPTVEVVRAIRVAEGLSARLRSKSQSCGLTEILPGQWIAEPWRPHDWLDTTHRTPDASAAGWSADDEENWDARRLLRADPFFENLTKFEDYRTPGQRAACRAVVACPPASTTIALLPTGSGKTEVALCLASSRKNTLTLLIVPTVALAYDFERRLKDFYKKQDPRFDASTAFAWTHATGPEVRGAIRSRIVRGTQPVLVTSPESMSRALHSELLSAAATGRLHGLVVDEAHLVTQWGRTFRPEFRSIEALRDTLLAKAIDAGHAGVRTLLLSATLGAAEIEDLVRLFGRPGPCTLIAANALRVEPEVWLSNAPDSETRFARVAEALAHLPRPAILYATSPGKAERMARDLRVAGYGRLAVVTGQTGGADRAQVLAGLRTDGSTRSSVDLVVATAAFGLGIDYPHIRSVVHACLPETIDRWYQEIGRGGRDGQPSTALLVSAPEDIPEAARLSIKVLTPETAQKRWQDLWNNRETVDGRCLVDLHGARGVVVEGDYNWRWNAQLVQGLSEFAAVERRTVERDAVAELRASKTEGASQDWVDVDPRTDLERSAFWAKVWDPWRLKEASLSDEAFRSMVSAARDEIPFCEAVADAYRPDDAVAERFGPAVALMEPLAPCGRCPACRLKDISPGEDPAPFPPQRWPVDLPRPSRLRRFAGATGNPDGLVILVADDVAVAAERLCPLLIRAGVRHVSGMTEVAPERLPWLYVDRHPITPAELTPVPSFVAFPRGHAVGSVWTHLAPRRANRTDPEQVIDVLLIHTDSPVPRTGSVALRVTRADLASTILEGA